MLNSMRNLSKSIVSKFLMIFLIITFAAWGVGDILRDGGPKYAVKVGDQTVSLSEFQTAYTALDRQLRDAGMQGVTPDRLQFSVIRQLVQQRLTLMAVQDLGLYANDTLAAKIIAGLPYLQDKDGKFDAKGFALKLRQQGLNERSFVAQIKNEAAGEFLADSLSMQDATVPTSVLSLESLISRETRDVVLFTIPANGAADEADAGTLQAFYEENKASLYMKPESRSFDYVTFNESAITAFIDQSITDDDIKQALAADPKTTEGFARLKLHSTRRDDAMQTLGHTIEDELAAGKKLNEAISKAGISGNTHTLSNVTETAKTDGDEITKTVAEQGFGLSEGEISGLISTKSGTMLMVAAKSITPATPKPYEEVKADVASRVSKKLARDAARTKAVAVRKALGESPNWQAVANEQKLSSRVYGGLERPDETKPRRTDMPFALQQAIFERNVGEVAGPLALDSGDIALALITKSHLPAASTEISAAAKSKLTEKMTSEIENRAYQSFTERHPVQVNPALLRAQAPEGE